ncbi:MAG: CCA tRNA nucleotidyltransferase [Solirubrobacteraceae bacterium]
MEADGRVVLERLRKLAGGKELLALADESNQDVELVGGAVRDILRGREPRELDVVVAEDAPRFAGELAARLHTLAGQDAQERLETHMHERFQTALVRWEGGEMDIATRRVERYATPGALPEVGTGTPEEDLLRRDFTVNAIAVGLNGNLRGKLRCVERGLDDLREGRLRVLHDRSFIDDPTRLLRMARYRARLGLEVDERTAKLAEEAISEEVLRTVSGARIGSELRLALTEKDAQASFRELESLGVLGALDPRLHLDQDLWRSARTLICDEDVRLDLLLLATVVLPLAQQATNDPAVEVRALLDRFEFAAGERDRVIACVVQMPQLRERITQASKPSELHLALSSVPAEAVALAGASAGGEARSNAQRWLTELSRVHLQITGNDLIKAGIPAGPEIGRRLDATLHKRLDGEIADGHEAELRAALQA